MKLAEKLLEELEPKEWNKAWVNANKAMKYLEILYKELQKLANKHDADAKLLEKQLDIIMTSDDGLEDLAADIEMAKNGDL